MVSALASRSSGLGASGSPGQRHCVVFLARHLSLTVLHSTQVYEWVPVNQMLGVTLPRTSIPSRGSS